MGAVIQYHQGNEVTEQGDNLEHVAKIESFRRLFADILARPSYIESIEMPALSELHERFLAYTQAFKSILDRVSTLPYEGNEGIHETFFGCTVGSSEGSEVRMLLMGLKPAVQSNWRAQEVKDWNERNLGVTFEEIGVFAIVQSTTNHSELAFCEANYSDNTTSILLDPKQLETVLMTYQDVFVKLGYDTNIPATDLARTVFKELNPIGISLLLGYPLSSAFIHHLLDLQTSLAKTSSLNRWFQLYWDSAEKILNAEQLQLLREIAQDESLVNSIAISLGEKGGQIYTNDAVRFRWEILGISRWLFKIRSQYYGEEMANEAKELL